MFQGWRSSFANLMGGLNFLRLHQNIEWKCDETGSTCLTQNQMNSNIRVGSNPIISTNL